MHLLPKVELAPGKPPRTTGSTDSRHADADVLLLVFEDRLDVLFHSARIRVIAVISGRNPVRADDLVDSLARFFLVLHKRDELVIEVDIVFEIQPCHYCRGM